LNLIHDVVEPFSSTRTLFFLFRKGVPPLLNVSVTVLYVGLRGFFFFVFGFITDLDLDFGLGLGFMVPANRYTRYRFRNGFDLQSHTILSEKNSTAVLFM
jgi:hypothetical protein